MKKLFQIKVSKIYAIIAIAVSLLCLVGYFSYAMFTVSKTKENALSIVTGGLNYTITGTGVTSNRITTTAGSTKSVTLTVTSQNDIDSKYQLYYQNNSNVEVYYLESNEDPFGTIEANGSIQITILIKNKASSSQTITLGVQGGYPSNELTLESGRTAVDDIGTFSITKRSVTGGTVTVSSSAQVGSTVTFTTSASSGFSYYGATIRDSSGSTLMTLNSSTKSFTMPSENVVVSPKWKYADKNIFQLDVQDDGAWTQARQEGVSSYASWQPSRHYVHCGGSSGLSRVTTYSNKTYDLTHYATYRVAAYESGTTSNITFIVGVSKTNTEFLRDVSTKTQKIAPGNDIWATIDYDITNLTGSYYLGFEIFSSVSYAAPFGSANLIGRVYE